jgi:predicted MFS family arabinose efflux permease
MAMRLALSNTAESAMSTIGPLAGGLIVLSLGYPVLFLVSMAFEAIALALLVLLVKEPRHRHIEPIEAAAFDEN